MTTVYLFKETEVGRVPNFMFCNICGDDRRVSDVSLEPITPYGKQAVKITWKGKCTTCNTELRRILYKMPGLRRFKRDAQYEKDDMNY